MWNWRSSSGVWAFSISFLLRKSFWEAEQQVVVPVDSALLHKCQFKNLPTRHKWEINEQEVVRL